MTADRPRRPRFSGTRMMAVAGLLSACALMAGLSGSTPASAADGACADGTGVTVVVDFTDLGGGIQAGCAQPDPATGRAALLAAGFVATDSQPGLLCAIDAMPDPCPTTFQGSFWSYWHSTPDGEWTSYQVGADASDPVAGELEGWRYNDGTTGPGIAPAAVPDALQPTSATATPDSADAAPTDPAPAADAADSALLFTTGGFTAVVAILVILLLVRSRRRGGSGSDGLGSD